MEIIIEAEEKGVRDLLSASCLDIENLSEIFKRAALECLAYEKISPENVEISLTFTDEESIRKLNKEFRGKDSVTDVLSFPQFDFTYDDDESCSIEEAFEFDSVMLGDVVICVSKALSQAEEYLHSPKREITYLFIHSVFHLLGYDHMNDEDKKEMRTAEKYVMGKMFQEDTV